MVLVYARSSGSITGFQPVFRQRITAWKRLCYLLISSAILFQGPCLSLSKRSHSFPVRAERGAQIPIFQSCPNHLAASPQRSFFQLFSCHLPPARQLSSRSIIFSQKGRLSSIPSRFPIPRGERTSRSHLPSMFRTARSLRVFPRTMPE